MAYDRGAYVRREHRNKIRDDGISWDHEKFFTRSESPRRARTEGTMANTRKGAWKSRAGGVYLPPDPVEEPQSGEEDDAEAPARYLHPEDFRKPSPPRRRSPSARSRRDSPVYELDRPPRERSRSRSLRRRSRPRSRSRSPPSRGSPVYD